MEMFEDMRSALEWDQDDWAEEFEGLKWDEWQKMLPNQCWGCLEWL